MIADVKSKDEARQIVPPAFRADARIIGLNKFTMEELDRIMSRHELREYGKYTAPSLSVARLAQDDSSRLHTSDVRLQK
jgi:hypothetical protein